MPAIAKKSKAANMDLFKNLLEKLKDTPGFPINLDFAKIEYTLSGHGFGSKAPKDDRVSITVYGIAAKYAYPLAVIRFKRADWVKFKKLGDGLFDGHRKLVKKMQRAKKKKV